MSFNWSAYLQLATQLSGSPNEAEKRTAISRAYYYAFHVANDFLRANKVALNPKLAGHERVWAVYIKSSRPECVKIGTDGNRLRVARRDADYVPNKSPSPLLVQRSIQDAQNIAHDVPLYLPDNHVEPPIPLRCKLVTHLRKLLDC